MFINPDSTTTRPCCRRSLSHTLVCMKEAKSTFPTSSFACTLCGSFSSNHTLEWQCLPPASSGTLGAWRALQSQPFHLQRARSRAEQAGCVREPGTQLLWITLSEHLGMISYCLPFSTIFLLIDSITLKDDICWKEIHCQGGIADQQPNSFNKSLEFGCHFLMAHLILYEHCHTCLPAPNVSVLFS